LASIWKSSWTRRARWSGPRKTGGSRSLDPGAQHSTYWLPAALADIHGGRVLEEIKTRHPETLRFAYAPLSPDPTKMKYWGAEHHLLSKPTSVRLLRDVLRRSFTFSQWLPDPSLQQVVANLQILPSPPPLYTELLLELQSPQSSLDSVGQLIARDPAMTAKVLQLANSAAMGLQQQVTDASTAVMYLGAETVKSLILLADTFSYFESFKPADISLKVLWSHLFRTARCARLIGQVEAMRGETSARIFTAGMLHDIGKLVVAVNLPEPFSRAVKIARQYRIPLWKIERDLLGTSHAEIGAALLGIWGVPHEIVEAVAWHHQPARSSSESFCALTAVHAANILARENHPDVRDVPGSQLDEEYLRGIGQDERIPLWRTACAAA
jgi:HD-like signal output (HDOD) protein